MHKKVVIDNNIIDFKNIEKLNNTNVFELVRTNEFSFLANERLFAQLIPYLQKCSVVERKKVMDFIRKLIGRSRILDTVKNISQREMEKANGNFWYIPSEKQKRIDYKKFESDDWLDNTLSNPNVQDENQFHKEMIEYMEKKRNLINEYSKRPYKNIDIYLTEEMKEKNFDDNAIDAVLNIVKKISDEGLSPEQKKKEIYKKYYNFMLEFSLLLQLRDCGQLIKNKDFFNEYYKDYYNIHKKYPFTKTMLNLTFFGYSYKVTEENNPKYDKDWANDNSYLCFMNYADILLTNDKGYMKDAFNKIYSGTQKEILTLDEFIDKYCETNGGN